MAVTSQVTVQYNCPANAGQSAIGGQVTQQNVAGIAIQQPVVLTTSFVDLKTLLPGGVYPTGVKFLYLVPDGVHNIYLGGTSASNTTILDGTATMHGPFVLGLNTAMPATPQVNIAAISGCTITVIME